MLLMLLTSLGVHQDIVYEHDHRVIEHRSVDPIHQVHKYERCVGEPKRHHHELVMSITSPERSLLHFPLPNIDLMVPGPQVYLREPRCSLQLFKKIIYPREWITVLHHQLVQLAVVNAHPV